MTPPCCSPSGIEPKSVTTDRQQQTDTQLLLKRSPTEVALRAKTESGCIQIGSYFQTPCHFTAPEPSPRYYNCPKGFCVEDV